MKWDQKSVDEYVKCRDDVEYFAQSYVKIVHPVHGLISLKLTDFQKDVIKNYKEKKIFSKVVDRQCGKTTIAAVLLLHHAMFNGYQTSAIISRRIDSSQYILNKIKEMYENLPTEIQNFAVVSKHNRNEVEFDTNSRIICVGRDPNMLRGRSLTNIYVDESEYITNLKEIVDTVYPVISSYTNARFFALTSSITSELFKSR